MGVFLEEIRVRNLEVELQGRGSAAGEYAGSTDDGAYPFVDLGIGGRLESGTGMVDD